jgi:LacI family transcriptional regulator
VDRKAKGIEADAVLSDNIGGAYLATKHLIERGHKRIGIVLGIPGATTTEERLLGYRQALEETGLPFTEDLVVWGGYRMEGGRKACAKLLSLSDPPTAIFSTNNLMTVGVLQELSHRGIKIPEEVAVVGFDDLEWAEIVHPPLTVVAQRPYEIGYQAFKILLERLNRLEGKQEVRVSVELKIRGSS